MSIKAKYSLLAVLIVLTTSVFFWLTITPGHVIPYVYRFSKPTSIILQPLGDMPSATYLTLAKELIKNGNIVLVMPPASFPASAYYKPRDRYRADTLIAWLSRAELNGRIIVGITDKDISTTMGKNIDWGVMGLGARPGNACVISTFRLKKAKQQEQLLKLCLHELGHTIGLAHCTRSDCYMRDAEGHNIFDNLHGFCTDCKKKLSSDNHGNCFFTYQSAQ